MRRQRTSPTMLSFLLVCGACAGFVAGTDLQRIVAPVGLFAQRLVGWENARIPDYPVVVKCSRRTVDDEDGVDCYFACGFARAIH